MELIGRNELFTKGYTNIGSSGYVEAYDFSKANKSKDSRVAAVSRVASVCYGNEGLKPNFNLYSKLERESIGLPSSSFEFVPILINDKKFNKLINLYTIMLTCSENDIEDSTPNIVRYGYTFITEGDKFYVLTNLRALMYDLQRIEVNLNVDYDDFVKPDNEIWYNTEEECEIIKEKFKVFKIKATIRDFRQLLRHRRGQFQEISRRFTTDKKVPFEFRYTKSVTDQLTSIIDSDKERVFMYHSLLKNGVKAEDARDILPVSLYSTLWCAFYPDGLNNFLNLRTKSSSQASIREIAENMKKFL